MTFFHFVLLQLPPATVEALTDLELLNALKTASSKRTHTVPRQIVGTWWMRGSTEGVLVDGRNPAPPWLMG
jgi:hypothetical protein